MQSEGVIYWDNSPFPGNQARYCIDSDGFVIDVFSLEPIVDIDSALPLFGVTNTGKQVSVFRLGERTQDKHHSIHNFDSAKGVALANAIETESYHTSFPIDEYIISDVRVIEPNPPVSSIRVIIDELRHLFSPFMQNVRDSEGNLITLFSNEVLSISFGLDKTERFHLLEHKTKQKPTIVFSFENDIAYYDAIDTWVSPIVQLLEILCGGLFTFDDYSVTSKSIGAIFQGSEMEKSRNDGQRANANTLAIPYGSAKRMDFQRLISEWMERPNTLRGIAPEILATRYGDIYAHSMLTASFRGIEALYADSQLQDLKRNEGLPLRPDGTFDLESKEYSRAKQLLKRLSRPKDAPFIERLKSAVRRFSYRIEPSERAAIDWDAFAEDAKNIRNSKAHGTIVGGNQESSPTKEFLIFETCFLLYTMSVVALAFEQDDDIPKSLSPKNKAMMLGNGLSSEWPRNR